MEVLALKSVADPKFRAEVMERILPREDKIDFNYCLSCGTCTAGCPFSSINENCDPRKFMRKIMLGLKDEVLNDPFIWVCTMCNRCAMSCPMGIEIENVVRCIRGRFGGEAPGSVQIVADAQLETRNQMRFTTEDFLDTIEWMEEEGQEEFDPNFKIPVNKKGAEWLLLTHAREVKYHPEDIKACARILNAGGYNWTFSTTAYDVANFGLFSGRDDEATKIMEFTEEAMKELGCKGVICTECGHGLWAHLFGQKNWMKFDYPIISIVKVMADVLREGKVKVDPSRIPEVVTLHDPCDLVRKAGYVEEPRYVLSQICENFVEMWPNREFNYCCGGGGGALATGPTIKPLRLAKGKLKADQVKATGAQILCAPCHNCHDQLSEINKEYDLGVAVEHLYILFSRAMVTE